MDLGCGTGYGTSLLSRHNDVIGIDSSSVAIAYAKRSLPEIEFVRASGESLPIRDGSLDAVVAFEVIEHLANPTMMLDECRRLLRKGGILQISTPNPAHLGNVWQNRLFGRPMPSKVDITNPYHVREFSYREMRTLLASKGFRIISASGQTLPLDWCVPGLGLVHRRLLPKAGLSDAYEWFSSRMARSLPSMAWTVVYKAARE
jgi:ubiquinone/menaquinone biosynthesis C-methylase UbiE